MKIVAFSQYYPPEIAAAGIRLHGLLKGLAARGDRVAVLTAIPNYPQRRIYVDYQRGQRKTENIDGVRVRHVSFFLPRSKSIVQRFLSYTSFMLSLLWSGWKEQRPDLVVATSPPLFTAVAAWIWAKLWRRPLLFDVQDLWPESVEALGIRTPAILRRLAYALAKAIYRRSSQISTVAHGIRRYLIEKKAIPPSRIQVVYNALDVPVEEAPTSVDEEEWKQDLDVEGKFVVLYAGNLGVAQRPQTLMEAAELLRGKPEIVWVIVGGGTEQEQMTEQAGQHGFTNIRMIGPVPRKNLFLYYRIANAGVVLLRDLPIFDAALPTKIFEYWGFSLPVIAGVRGEAKELIQQREGGLCFPPEDAKGLTEAVLRLQESPEMCHTYGAAGRRAIDEEFNKTKQAERFAEAALRAVAHK
jgi:colanic acid biosynthesis glycosyl transferase WcaI